MMKMPILLIGLILALGGTAMGAEWAAPAAAPGAAYKPMLSQGLALLGERRVDDFLAAVGFAAPNVPSPLYDETQRRLSAEVVNLGKHDGFDFVGSKELTPRIQQVNAFVYFERRAVLISIQMYLIDGKWRAQAITAGGELDHLLDSIPLTR